MVAQERDQPGLPGQGEQTRQHAARVRPAINVIAQRDQRVLASGGDGIQDRFQGRQAAVNVADSNGAGCHVAAGPGGTIAKHYNLPPAFGFIAGVASTVAPTQISLLGWQMLCHPPLRSAWMALDRKPILIIDSLSQPD